MGITGLLPFLEKASKKCNISEFSGCTVAVDTYCWLHKGAFSCADKIARGEYTDAHIKYCLKYVNMLLSHSIKPILVFDGRHLPAKAMTEKKRRESRNMAKKRAAELLRLGQVEEARSYMRRCVDITHEMALQLIKECRQKNVDCIVAPYEADAQMAYLNKINIADIVITEDSDLVLFGCQKIFFKMDLNGDGVLVESSKLSLVMKCPLEHYNFNKFRQMCIMSGCDYLPSLPGIGLAKARQFINATRDPDIRNALKKVPSYFNKTRQLVVTDEYRDSFAKAEATFKHQLVYDPVQRMLVPLNSLESEGTDAEFCSNAGEQLDPDVAFQLALGNLDPFTLTKMDDWHPDHARDKVINVKTNGWSQSIVAPHKSIWSSDYIEYSRRWNLNRIPKCKTETAITFPSTRTLMTKMMPLKNSVSPEKRLTIEDLSSMYCPKQPIVKNVIIPETQDLDIDLPVNNNLFKSPNGSSDQNQTHSSRKRRRISLKENTPSPEKERSPILESRNKNFRRYLISNMNLSKLSKFQRTTLDDDNFVESKFFNSSSAPVENNQESGLNISGIAKLHVDEAKTDDTTLKMEDRLSDLDLTNSLIHNRHLTSLGALWNVDCMDNISSSLVEKKKSVNPFSIHCPSSKSTDSQSSYNENTYPLEDLVTPDPSQELPDCIENTEEYVFQTITKPVLQKKLEKSHSQPLIKSNGYIRNITSNTCRRPGLQKKASSSTLSAGQTTLASFGFFKKSQLKH